MCMNKEANSLCCCIFTIITSLLSAAGISALFFSSLITSVTALLVVTLVLGILGLLYVLFTTFCGKKYQCKYIKESCLIPTSIGAIITTVFALTATSLAVSVTTSILIGAVGFFLVANLINLVNVVLCKLCFSYCED